MDLKYAIIIPAKNEEESLPRTLDSIVSQTKLPEVVVIVDDSSTDNTSRVIKKYSDKYPFIKYSLKQGKNNTYSLGGKVVEVFNHGLKFIDDKGYDYDYVVKMDADIFFREGLFQELTERLKNQKFGIVSCTPYMLIDKTKLFINSPGWHTNGDFKMYHKKCLEKIGGLKKDLGWDCADNIMAMNNGWDTMVFRDLYYEQVRPIGRYSVKKGIVRQGIGAYKLRHSLPYILIKIMHDMVKKPYIIGGFYYLQGYFKAYFKFPERTLSKREGKILRGLLWKSFFDRLRNGDFVIFQIFKKNEALNN
jgi:glycosyltransferase involved in cell wall biosynthesis